jgi:hypothetical protein
MKPPFWEVTIARQISHSEPPVIESVDCFTDRPEAEDYRRRSLGKDSSLRITIRLVTHSSRNSAMIELGSSLDSRDRRGRLYDPFGSSS